jgi:ectoine hydroxylase-related dioxygenase (phytanoyl-CoA dioxygenase family)
VSWPEEGVVIHRGILPDDLIDAYCKVREPFGPVAPWSPTAYMTVPELRDLALCEPVVEAVEAVIGEPAAMHLNLHNWVSTERTWHQDDYLQPFPDGLNDRYCGAWFALDDVNTLAGPFQWISGSRSWPFLTREQVLAQLKPDERGPDWPRAAEPFVTEHWEIMRASGGRRSKPGITSAIANEAKVETFYARRGDLLLWHSRVVHRGSKPAVPNMERRALIVHYSAIDARPDMGGWDNVECHMAGHYFKLGT